MRKRVRRRQDFSEYVFMGLKIVLKKHVIQLSRFPYTALVKSQKVQRVRIQFKKRVEVTPVPEYTFS